MADMKEEDPLLRYAYVPKANKLYAIRFQGRIADMPYIFAKRIEESFSGRARHEEVNVVTAVINGQDQLTRCKQGDWIVVDQTDPENILAFVYTDGVFQKNYSRVSDFSYE